MGENAYVLGRASAVNSQKFGNKESGSFANINSPALQSGAVYLFGLLAMKIVLLLGLLKTNFAIASVTRKTSNHPKKALECMEWATGFEPATPSLGISCSSNLATPALELHHKSLRWLIASPKTALAVFGKAHYRLLRSVLLD